MNAKTEELHQNFEALPVSETCTWPGTEWENTGGKSKLKPCGNLTIGAGIFCDPLHLYCQYYSVCKRHKGTISFWGDE